MDGKSFEEVMPAPLLTSKEAAAILRVSERTLWSITSPRGPIRPVRIGPRSVRYAPAVIQEYIEVRIGVPPTMAV